jgi:hypothetical protein
LEQRGVTARRYGPIVEEIDDDALEEALADACAAASDKDFESVVSVASARRAAAAGDDDPIRALIADLLWEAKFGDRPYEFAQTAVDSHIVATNEDFGHPVELSEAIQRAVEIAAQINDQARRSAAIDAAVRLTEAAIESGDRIPGVALPLLAMFIGDRQDRCPPNPDQLLERAIERFGDDPWNLESALELQAKLVPPAERDALRTRGAEAIRDLAHRSEGLVK